MLVLSTTSSEPIVLSAGRTIIRIHINQIRGQQVSLAFDAPDDVQIYRESVLHRVLRNGPQKPRLRRHSG